MEKTEKKKEFSNIDRIRLAHEIRSNPPKPGYMEVEVKPAIYSIDLNTDSHWWFNHSCTVFPLILDQAKRTHMDLKDSFKPKKRLPDFNYMFVFFIVIGLIGLFVASKILGLW